MIAFQAPRQVGADVAAPGENDAADRVVEGPHFLHDRLHVARGGEEEDRVVFLDDRIAVGHDEGAVAIDRRDPGVAACGHVMAQFVQLLAYQATAGIGPCGDQLGPSVGEVEDLAGAGVFDQAGDMLGDQLLGADQHVDGRMFAREQALVFRVFR